MVSWLSQWGNLWMNGRSSIVLLKWKYPETRRRIHSIQSLHIKDFSDGKFFMESSFLWMYSYIIDCKFQVLHFCWQVYKHELNKKFTVRDVSYACELRPSEYRMIWKFPQVECIFDGIHFKSFWKFEFMRKHAQWEFDTSSCNRRCNSWKLTNWDRKVLRFLSSL